MTAVQVPAVEGAAGTNPRTWTLHVPSPAPFLTPNVRKRLHWRVEAAHTKSWRDLTWTLAKQAHLPTGLSRARIDVELHYRTNQSRDDANLVDIAKPCVDALGPPFVRVTGKRRAAVGYGLIPDDDPKHLDGPHVEIGGNDPTGQWGSLDMLITDLSDLSPRRTWSPDQKTERSTRISVKRCCNGCGQKIGDVLNEEIEAAMSGLPLPDVRSECPACREAAR